MGGRSYSPFDDLVIKSAIANTVTGTTTINGDIIDTSGFEGVCFVVRFTTPAANNTIKVQQGALANMTDAVDLAGTLVAVGASDEIVVCQVKKPAKRYLRVLALRGTTTVIEAGFALLFGSRRYPVANALAGTLAGESFVTPGEGTALMMREAGQNAREGRFADRYHPDQGLPPDPYHPDQGLPEAPETPSNELPQPPARPGQALPQPPARPGQALPQPPARPSQALPEAPARPGQALPEAPGTPDQGLPAKPAQPKPK